MRSTSPIILFYTSYFGKPVDIAAIPECGSPVEWTNDRRRLSEATAVVFHLPDFREIADARKYGGQDWVAWSMESRRNYPLMADPRFMRHFDITMTYETGSDVWAPYLPPHAFWQKARASPIARKTETALAVHFQSSKFDDSRRGALVAELSHHVGVDRYGRHQPNRHVEGPDLGRQTKLEIISRYPFCLALENSIAPDYVTEKMFDPLAAGTVPVYLGAPNAARFVPENSYIDAASFGSPAQLAAYLRHLVETPAEYQAYFAWRDRPLPERLADWITQSEVAPTCRLAALVHRRLAERQPGLSRRSSLPFGPLPFLRARLRRWRKG
ncbi:glycosyltransferase family 10 fucosyltransferase [Mesorhizobium erdmanii]|uniref:Alpha-1,3-fucosyltransferase n=1 Tax=Mesorhizobium erdmanii TaxID=1777866 RepID=A0A6M7UAL1_9HYPH|nr:MULTISPECIES: glycosyltransferase family 10 fucosyltransferase [Mesorhizobium]OBQ67627.1 alpha-1,3-fucosyltransferase [Mesorhizobium loti]QKC74361.1 alpha-1,3-fucosyltransferase [Mesorhizobium erdmanii]